jgi:hypothetical protein
MKNIRFWVWNWATERSGVRLTLKPGESLEHCYGGPTEEGYSWTCETWTLDVDQFNNPIVRREISVDASDCDGRLCDANECEALVPTLPTTYEELEKSVGGWCRTGSQHRDYSAEAMGY